jgi:hypothetical protein
MLWKSLLPLLQYLTTRAPSGSIESVKCRLSPLGGYNPIHNRSAKSGKYYLYYLIYITPRLIILDLENCLLRTASQGLLGASTGIVGQLMPATRMSSTLT